MKKILVLGAGRSSSSLINYLLENSTEEGWKVRVGDYALELAQDRCKNSENGYAFAFDIGNEDQLNEEVKAADIVVSMLPAKYHVVVAKSCLKWDKNMVTASYVSKEMQAYDAEAKERGIIILNECGLDPGIDHMSAMKVIDEIRHRGGVLTGFESFTGGLLAPGTDEKNPWEYKFTWNPRNVILAGQGVVKFIQEGTYKYIPYQKVFRRTEQVHIPGYGYFEGYANRDSLNYLDIYGLRGIKTIYRGTFRRPGFCRTWNVFVQLGATDDSYEMEGVKDMTHRSFINSFLSYNPNDSVELKLAYYLNLDIDGPEMHRLRWAGIFDHTPVGLTQGTPAQILEHILKKKWTLKKEDKDMIVMWHKFQYEENGEEKEIHSTLVAIGDDDIYTAMSKTVGLPLGIATKLILQGKVHGTGVQIPIKKEIYAPILKELSSFGFEMTEKEVNNTQSV
ncbi:saccharopine dehydrogenase family protein [Fulvivirga sediminis]|uniref:Saccharopine dehydrogenase NADP-binding domain-containing protein n=1 Tax=Fulvivirga sediminis TaxID=2803949 RepID=A0A937K0L2_9BACT|nr:saccharopine dehydrogenase C-terminal domain-containing protein [Fulvivirga sediminis]MBL3656456.1 saccharopine dehydrogenase NADP-binding domain-containing protein [Fulvivirga sediminis]